MSRRPPAPLRQTSQQAAAAAALRAIEEERNTPDPVLKWIGIGEKPTPEFVSRCGRFKARRNGKKWDLYVRDDPHTEAEYVDLEEQFSSKKELQRECEALAAMAEIEDDNDEVIVFG